MFNGYLSIIALSGAVLCTLLAVVLSVVFLNQRREQRTPAAEPPSRMDDSAQRIARILSAESGGVIDAPRQREGQEIPAPDLRRSLEVANGLQILSQASPEIALHDVNIALLGHLREVTGASDFRYLCGQLAMALSNHDPRFQGLASGLENGELSWNSFLAELRAMPMAERF